MRGALFTVAVAVALGCVACTGPSSGASSTSQPGTASASADQAGYFTVPADQLPHLQVAPVRRTVWSTIIRTTGTVDWDTEHTTQVITQVSGPISRIVADTGTRVKVGDPLLYLASADVANAIANYRKASNRYALAQRTLNRSKDLLAHKALAQRDYDAAEADFHDAATDQQSALEALRIFGVTHAEITDDERQDASIRPELVMRAPLAGTVVQRMVLPGQFIQAGTTAAFVITNTSTVWVQGHVYDRDLASIHVGDSVEVRNTSLPDTFHGVVSYIGDLIDPTTRTTPVRIVTQNPEGLLKKDLFVDVVIHDRSTQDVVVVPTTAVLYDEQNFPFVYVQRSGGQFAERQVTLGSQQGADTQIRTGLKPGEPVVSQGSVFLQFANTYRQ